MIDKMLIYIQVLKIHLDLYKNKTYAIISTITSVVHMPFFSSTFVYY